VKQKRNNIVYFRINDEIKDSLYELAAENKRTVSSAVAYIVEAYINSEEDDENMPKLSNKLNKQRRVSIF